jgi:hypothetical protein
MSSEKKAKKRFEPARRACSEEVESSNAGPITTRVDDIIRDVVRHTNGSSSYPFYGGI